ncbi:uncharacterized protein [Euphorbia lathyris]|uniref:uncharacterized protein isoform X1 n=1 Tax=Euphorbia lathyris TaxID=212925 RepID=UPI0033143D1C
MDTNSSERDNQDWNGLCAKTKVVMQYLNQYFMNQKKKREQEVVSWMPLVEGRSKKRNAMLFYEILGLRRGYDGRGYVSYGVAEGEAADKHLRHPRSGDNSGIIRNQTSDDPDDSELGTVQGGLLRRSQFTP